MALQAQTLPVSFNQGVDTKTDPKKVPVGKLLTLQNATFQNLERFNKRNGTQIIANIPDPVVAAGTLRNQLILMSQNFLYSFLTNGAPVLNRGPLVPLNITDVPIANNGRIYDSPDIAYDPNVNRTLFVYQFVGTIIFTIVDNSNNVSIFQNITLDTGTQSKVMFFEGVFVILFFDTINNDLRYRTVNPANGAIGNSVAIANDIDIGHPWFDCATFHNRIYFAYNTIGGTTTINFLDNNFNLGAPVPVLAPSITSIHLFPDPANNIFLINGGGEFLGATVLDPNLGVIVPNVIVDDDADNDVCAIGGIFENNVGNIFFERRRNSGSNREYFGFISTFTMTVGGVVGPVAPIVRGLGLWSKPFVMNGVIYAVAAYGADAQSQNVGGGSVLNTLSNQQQYFVLSFTGTVCGKIGFGSGGGVTVTPKLCEVQSAVAGQFLIPYLFSNITNLSGGEQVPFYSVYQATFDFTATVHPMNEQSANELHLSGGFISMYDGVNLVEHGFHLYPEQAMITATAASGTALGVGQYEYGFVYAYIDAQGQVHRSAPTFITVSTTAGNQNVHLVIPYLRVTAKQTPGTWLEIYRTQVSQSTLYQMNAFSLDNHTDQDVLAFVDDTTDGVLPGAPLLYTNSGEYENIAAPSSNILALSQERLFVIPSISPQSFWYSKQVIPGSPVEFSDFLVGNINPIGGDITAVAAMDDKTIFFKNKTCWVMTGSGPSPNGSQNDFSDPQLIPTGKGCINPVSVVLIPQGLLFQSQAGIYLLDRGLNSNYIGAPVEAFNNLTISSAVLVPTTTFVRFTMSDGTVLNYDYLTNQWSNFTNMNAVDALIWNDLYTYLGVNQSVIQETPGTYLDFDGSYISMNIVTSWIPLAGIQGFQRAYFGLILGDYYSPHILQMQLAYDYDPALVQNIQVPVPAAQVPYQNQFMFQQQKCQAIQFTIQDLPPPNPADFGHGCDLSELTLEVGMKKGLFKVPASQKYG